MLYYHIIKYYKIIIIFYYYNNILLVLLFSMVYIISLSMVQNFASTVANAPLQMPKGVKEMMFLEICIQINHGKSAFNT